MKSHLYVCICVVALPVLACSVALSAEPFRNRREFIAALNKVQEEMPEAEVLKLLGKPDDIRTYEDHDGTYAAGVVEWRYGTSGHLTTATLGTVLFDPMRRVHKYTGICGKGETVPEGMFEESQLRLLLKALGDVETRGEFNPRPLIRAVNLLQPLGKEKALVVIEEYIRRRKNYNDIRVGFTVDFVLRVLFEVPADPGYFPAAGLWFPPETPAQRKLVPRYPIVMIDDIPVRIGQPAWLGGAYGDPAEVIPYFRKRGVFRAKLLVPTNKPFAALEEYAKSPQWYKGPDGEDDDAMLWTIRYQLLTLLETVYQVEEGDPEEPPQFEDLKDSDTRLAEASKLQIRWDSKSNQYTFLDGKSLPLLDVSKYRRQIWHIPESGDDFTLIFERDTRHRLSIRAEKVSSDIQIFNIKAKEKLLCKPSILRGGSVWTGIRFDEGEQLQAEVTVNNKTYLSPVFKP